MLIQFCENKFLNETKHPKYQSHLKNKKIVLNLNDINKFYETKFDRLISPDKILKYESLILRGKLLYVVSSIIEK